MSIASATVAADATPPVADPASVERLRLGPPDRKGPMGLAEHHAVHGRLPIPHDDGSWAEAVRRAISQSGLAGRGGAGFPSAAKWDALRRVRRRPTVVVNALEGEPASAKDRTLLARAPHLVLDGAEVAAAVVGASEVVVCLPDREAGMASLVESAVADRRQGGMRARHISVRRAPSGYVTGEESALTGWLGGGAARPTTRWDKSVPLRVSGHPVLVHNAETLAHLALVVRHGAGWFRRLGTPEAPGTALVTVTGRPAGAVVLEVALGTSVGDIMAGAGVEVSRVSAALVGGYGGAWLDSSRFVTPYAPRPLAAAGATTGVGIVVGLPDTACGLAETARIVRYLAGESTGQCGPCVFGLPAIASDLERLAAGRGDPRLLERIVARTASVDGRGACRLPDGAARLVRSALAVFADDASAHADGRSCAGHRHPTVLPFPAVPDSPQRAS